MAFITENGGIDKQRLTLSVYANEIIEADLIAFKEKNLNHFFNKIFKNYYPIADASISLRLYDFQLQLENYLIEQLKIPLEIEKKIIVKLCDEKKSELMTAQQKYHKEVSHRFSLNKENFEYLTGDCNEDKHYKKRKDYIECVIEEYVRLPYVKREIIIYEEFVSKIDNSITKKKLLQVETDLGKKFDMLPYKIMQDPLSTANYLVGYTRDCNDSESSWEPHSFRISAISSLRVGSAKKGLSKEQILSLEKFTNTRTPQFMLGDNQEILVRLTDAGKRKYTRQMHMRPKKIEEREDNVFVFHCPFAQAEFYFFKFGKDAEIISPLTLRNKFREMYLSASSIYL